MTVAELIDELKRLDQDRGIWVMYETIAAYPPLPSRRADRLDEAGFSDEGVEYDDYIIQVG